VDDMLGSLCCVVAYNTVECAVRLPPALPDERCCVVVLGLAGCLFSSSVASQASVLLICCVLCAVHVYQAHTTWHPPSSMTSE